MGEHTDLNGDGVADHPEEHSSHDAVLADDQVEPADGQARGLVAKASYNVWSPNHSGRGGADVIWLVVHTAEGATTASGLAAFLARSSSQVSYHVVVDDRDVIQCVGYDQESWSARGANPRSDQVCCTGFVAWSRATWLAHDGMLTNLARWLADRARARGIPLEHIGAPGVARRARGVIGHGDYTVGARDGTHTDPGPNFPWDVVIARARQLAGQGPAPAPGPAPSPTPGGYPSIREGDTSELVWRLQVFMNRVFPSYSRIDAGPTPPSRCGPQTVAVLTEFQRRVGIPTAPPFEVGQKTWAQLVRYGFR